MRTKFLMMSGTPGTGKTSTSTLLARAMCWQHIDLGKIALRNGLTRGYDRRRGIPIVDLRGIRNEVLHIARNSGSRTIILDGCFSHLVPLKRDVLAVVILRCHPDELACRLRGKGWGEVKIRENVQAEILGVCKSEALQLHRRIREIDTTGGDASRVSMLVAALYKGGFPRIAGIDWLTRLERERGMLRWMV